MWRQSVVERERLDKLKSTKTSYSFMLKLLTIFAEESDEKTEKANSLKTEKTDKPIKEEFDMSPYKLPQQKETLKTKLLATGFAKYPFYNRPKPLLTNTLQLVPQRLPLVLQSVRATRAHRVRRHCARCGHQNNGQWRMGYDGWLAAGLMR